jgi:hypothetical protein
VTNPRYRSCSMHERAPVLAEMALR